jgi:hypothetical protein
MKKGVSLSFRSAIVNEGGVAGVWGGEESNRKTNRKVYIVRLDTDRGDLFWVEIKIFLNVVDKTNLIKSQVGPKSVSGCG